MIDTYSDRPRKSSVIFGDLQKCLENVRKTFVCPSDNVWRIFGNLRSMVGKIVINVVIGMFMYCGDLI